MTDMLQGFPRIKIGLSAGAPKASAISFFFCCFVGFVLFGPHDHIDGAIISSYDNAPYPFFLVVVVVVECLCCPFQQHAVQCCRPVYPATPCVCCMHTALLCCLACARSSAIKAYQMD